MQTEVDGSPHSRTFSCTRPCFIRSRQTGMVKRCAKEKTADMLPLLLQSRGVLEGIFRVASPFFTIPYVNLRPYPNPKSRCNSSDGKPLTQTPSYTQPWMYSFTTDGDGEAVRQGEDRRHAPPAAAELARPVPPRQGALCVVGVACTY